jgi:hypothetical protein
MKRLLVAVAALVLIAATPEDVLPGLEANGYYIESGSTATEQVVSDAVFEGRSDGGRLYIVVLADEPPGGATTFSDSTLDLLDSDGYVVTVGPETVGFAGDGSFWTAGEMNAAIDASLDGSTDDEVIQIFVGALTDVTPGGGEAPASSGGGISIVWILVIGGGLVAVWWFVSKRNRASRSANRMGQVKELAKRKLDEVANDILEMEDEVVVSDNPDVKARYQRASAMYAQAMDDTERADTVAEMVSVSEELDTAIWELDCTEALLDGKPLPPKPEPAKSEPVVPPSPPAGHGESMPAGTVPPVPGYDRRPQRQSSGSGDMMSMLMTMLAMQGMRGRGGFGGSSGGWTGSGGGAPRPPMGGGGGRIRGGGRRRG